MRIACIGGGPGGLFFAILMKRADPSHEVTVYERNRADDPFGFGVVFSDATGENISDVDPSLWAEMERQFARWDDIDIHYRGEVLTSTGHGFSGLSRRSLLETLVDRADSVGVDLRFETEIQDLAEVGDVDLVVACDGANSGIRDRYAEQFRPTLDERPNRFVWMGTTRPFPAFTFYFRGNEHGLWRVHAYQYEGGRSTFIVEAREETWTAAGLPPDDEDAAIDYCERLFAEELEGHRLIGNRSIWRRFVTVRNERWHHGNLVLLGDSAHTAHFSIGSGTKLAMEDAIALAESLRGETAVEEALAAYEAERRPVVESTQRAAQVSLQWFEDTERYMEMEPIQFGFNLLTRSLRVTHDNLRIRDPEYVEKVDRWFAGVAEAQSRRPVPRDPAPPPLFTPYRVRDLVLENRVVVSPMCQYCAVDGMPTDWHMVHLGSRAVGGAGLVMAEMTDVSAEGRITHGCAGLYRDEHVSGWKRIVDFVHANSSAKIGVQLGHAGRKGATKVMWEGMDEPLEDPKACWPVLSASPIPYHPHSQVPKEMDRPDMDAVKADFVAAAERAQAAGFDWLEMHCAHGYLLASFVSPLTNQRTDEYGGALPNRMRYPLEVFDALRAVWPEEKPMSVRISAVDWAEGGVDSAEAVEIARMFRAHGVDIIDVSAGQTVAEQRPRYGRLFQTPFSDRIRHEAGMPTMAVGNISSYTDVNTILAAGRADVCLMARAHLWNPYWTRHAAYEMEYPLEWPPQYRSLKRYTPRFLP